MPVKAKTVLFLYKTFGTSLMIESSLVQTAYVKWLKGEKGVKSSSHQLFGFKKKKHEEERKQKQQFASWRCNLPAFLCKGYNINKLKSSLVWGLLHRIVS